MNRRVEQIFVEGKTLEYSIIGEGIPILILHGGHSNCWEELGYEALVRQGYAVITPSRPGYGNTDKEIGTSLAKACEAYVCLLNHLKMEKVHVIAVSAGGPSGIYFAAHCSERVKSFTLQSAVTKEWLTPKDKEYRVARVLFRPGLEKITWKLVASMNNRFPRFIFHKMAPSFSKLAYEEVLAAMNEEDIEEMRKMNNRMRSGHGFFIDLAQTGSVSPEDLRAISCPTLILHSKHDGSVPVEHAYHAHQHIPHSVLCLLDTWGHLIWLGKGSEETDKRLLPFLAAHQ
jgi:pimeloyl-ACP methyl ester carboxylesterase